VVDGYGAQLMTRNNALAETVNGYYKAELIYGPARTGPGRPLKMSSCPPSGGVYWHNTARLHSYLGDIPPAEFEAASTMTHGPTNP
jgi:putative transposase